MMDKYPLSQQKKEKTRIMDKPACNSYKALINLSLNVTM
jgi:hypothetical protein